MDELKKLMENAGISEIKMKGEDEMPSILEYFDQSNSGRIKDGYIAKIETERGDEWVDQVYVLPVQKSGRDDYGKHQSGTQYYSVNNWQMSSLTLRKIRIYKMEQVV